MSAGDTIMSRGLHRGKTIAELYETAPDYLMWLANQARYPESSAAAMFIDEIQVRPNPPERLPATAPLGFAMPEAWLSPGDRLREAIARTFGPRTAK